MKLWKTLSTETICKTRVFNVLKRKMKIPNEDVSADFFTLEAPDWVNVIAITQDHHVILVKQYRHGIHEISLEIPGGVISEQASSPMEAAMMELQEETGYSSTKWTSLGSVTSNPALFTNRCHLFLAEGCIADKSIQLDEHERIETVLMPIPDFLNAVKSGEIHHALVVSAVSRYLLHTNYNV